MSATRRPGRAPAGRRLLAGPLLALLAFLALLVIPSPAGAATAPCEPAPDTGCVAGKLSTAEGEPVAGVALTVEGQGESVQATSGADGTWSAAVTVAGVYTVTLDVATLPDGVTLADPTATSRTVSALMNDTARAIFKIGPPGSAGGPTTTPAPGSTAEATTPPDNGSSSGGGSGVSAKRVWQQLANGLIFGLLLALASVGLSLVYGTTGLSSFSHGEQVTLGAIVAYWLTQMVGLPLWLSVVLAVVVGAASGWLQDWGLWYRLRKHRIGLTQQMIVTIGLSMVLQYTYQFIFGGGRLRIDTANPQPVQIGPVLIPKLNLVTAGISIVVLAGVAAFLLYSRTGRATRAVSDNPALAAASGIGVERIIRVVWTGAAGLAALGGVFMGLYFQATYWNMGGTVLLLMFAAVTLGGLGTAWGALAGSMVIGVVAEMSSLVIPPDIKYAGALFILILVLLVRPQGILGRRDRIG